MFTEAVHRARRSGFEGVLFYCVENNHVANRSGVAGVEAAGVPCSQVFTLDYWMALPRAVDTPESIVPETGLFLEASEALAARLSFAARVWSKEEAEVVRVIPEEYNAVSFATKSGGNAGLITGYILSDSRGTACAQIENVLVDQLDPEQKSAALRGFLAGLVGKAQIAMAPAWNSVEEAVFRKAGFQALGPTTPERLPFVVGRAGDA